jgi:hypothetical protein
VLAPGAPVCAATSSASAASPCAGRWSTLCWSARPCTASATTKRTPRNPPPRSTPARHRASRSPWLGCVVARYLPLYLSLSLSRRRPGQPLRNGPCSCLCVSPYAARHCDRPLRVRAHRRRRRAPAGPRSLTGVDARRTQRARTRSASPTRARPGGCWRWYVALAVNSHGACSPARLLVMPLMLHRYRRRVARARSAFLADHDTHARARVRFAQRRPSRNARTGWPPSDRRRARPATGARYRGDRASPGDRACISIRTSRCRRHRRPICRALCRRRQQRTPPDRSQ